VPIAFTGIVAGLAGHCPSATFDIGSIFVTTTAATNYAKGACQSNSDGKVVAVQGLLQSNGTVIATALTYITNRADDPHQRMKTDPTGSSGR
jgi:hypothetical protein